MSECIYLEIQALNKTTVREVRKEVMNELLMERFAEEIQIAKVEIRTGK